MIAPRFHRSIALASAFALVVSAFAPMAAVCQEMEAARAAHCAEMEGMGAMAHHGAMSHDAMHGAPMDDAPSEGTDAPAERPAMADAMPCCTVAATTMPRVDAERVLALTAAVQVLRTARPAQAAKPMPLARDTGPPDLAVPIHIALGRFLT